MGYAAIIYSMICIGLILLPLIAVESGYTKRKAAQHQYLLMREIPFFS
jgi:glycopeptide antibiotics resistance protein